MSLHLKNPEEKFFEKIDKILKEENLNFSQEKEILLKENDLTKYRYLLNIPVKLENNQFLKDIEIACQRQDQINTEQENIKQELKFKKWQEQKQYLLENTNFLKNNIDFLNYLDKNFQKDTTECQILTKMINYGISNEKILKENNLYLNKNDEYSLNTNFDVISKTISIGLKLNFCAEFEENDSKEIFEFILKSSKGQFNLKKTDNSKNFFKIPFISLNMGRKENFLMKFLKINTSFLYFPKSIENLYFIEKCQIWLGESNVFWGDIRY